MHLFAVIAAVDVAECIYHYQASLSCDACSNARSSAPQSCLGLTADSLLARTACCSASAGVWLSLSEPTGALLHESTVTAASSTYYYCCDCQTPPHVIKLPPREHQRCCSMHPVLPTTAAALAAAVCHTASRPSQTGLSQVCIPFSWQPSRRACPCQPSATQ